MTAAPAEPNPYDEVPYLSLSFAETHPDRMAVIATLAGLEPPAVERCRVLELGCATGANLAAMALGLPDAEFVGVDYAGRQIAEGRETLRAVGIKNVRLEHRDILDVDAHLGEFDYVISHGVYSWVPGPVREKLLDVCRQNLAPNGIAYVSYNTYPGWHMLAGLREMMLWHTRDVADPHERAAEARRLAHFLTEALSPDRQRRGSFLHAYAALLESNRDNLDKRDALLLHDELSPVNEPVYFHQFVEAAGRHGLQYLAETPFSLVMPSNLPKSVVDTLRTMARTPIEMEQYMDFVRNRTFRQSLLCHEGQAIQHQLKGDPETVGSFSVATQAEPEDPGLDPTAAGVARFHTAEGATLSTDHPVSKAALHHLAAISPVAVPFADLLEEGCRRIYGVSSPTPDDLAADARVLASNLVSGYCYSRHLVEFHTRSPQFAAAVSERPVASPLARYLAAHDYELVPSLRHERIELDAFSRQLLPYLDGQRDHEALFAVVSELAAQHRITIEEDGQPVDDPGRSRAILAAELEANLRWLARSALLVA